MNGVARLLCQHLTSTAVTLCVPRDSSSTAHRRSNSSITALRRRPRSTVTIRRTRSTRPRHRSSPRPRTINMGAALTLSWHARHMYIATLRWEDVLHKAD